VRGAEAVENALEAMRLFDARLRLGLAMAVIARDATAIAKRWRTNCNGAKADEQRTICTEEAVVRTSRVVLKR
jgi:hypothetical protein